MKFKSLLLSIIISAFAVNAYAADNVAEMLSEGSVKGIVRYLNYSRDFEKSKDRADSAIGGRLYYKSAPLHGISFGVTFATVRNAGSDDDKGVYSILAADSNGNHADVTRVQESYIQGEWFKTKIRYGAQELNTPYMNMHDSRMIAKAYKGLSVESRVIENLELFGYYITEYAGWTDDGYGDISKTINPDIADKALTAAAFRYTFPFSESKLSIENWFYNLNDAFNLNFAKASYTAKVNNIEYSLAPGYLIQKSIGDEIGGDIDSYQVSFDAGVKAYGLTLKGIVTKVGDDNLTLPWGGGPIIQEVMTSERAEEKAYAASFMYDLGEIGVNGLSAGMMFGYYDTPDKGKNASTDVKETDFDVIYNFGKNFKGVLDGLTLRARYAILDRDDAEDINDMRFYVMYNFSLDCLK